MSIDHKAFLAIAFRELERFSVPGVGTFVRQAKPASIDPKTRQISPPGSYIQLEEGERHLVQLYQYLADRGSLRREQAEKYAQELGHFVNEYTKISGGLEVKGVGRLTKNAAGRIVFEPAMDDPSFSSYALKPVMLPDAGATEEQAPDAKGGKKEAAKAGKKGAKQGKAAEGRTTRPKGRAAREQEKEQRTGEDALARSRRTSMILFGSLAAMLMLIIGMMGYAIYLENESRKDSAIYKPITADSLARAKADSLQAAERKAQQLRIEHLRDSLRKDSLAQAEKLDGKKGKAKAKTKPPKTTEPAAANTPATGSGKTLDVTHLSEGATYHLIVASFDDKSEADAKAAQWRRKGYTPTVLPGTRTARYRLSVFNTHSKTALAAKYAQVSAEVPDVWVYSAQ